MPNTSWIYGDPDPALMEKIRQQEIADALNPPPRYVPVQISDEKLR